MGASGWHYVTEHSDDLDAVLHGLHQRVLASGDYHWADASVPRAGSLAELHELYGENEELAMCGTHSVLDVFRTAAAGSPDDFGTLVPLTGEQVLRAFGTATPTRERFEEVYVANAGLVDDVERWSGRATTLYASGRPSAVVVWGISGD